MTVRSGVMGAEALSTWIRLKSLQVHTVTLILFNTRYYRGKDLLMNVSEIAFYFVGYGFAKLYCVVADRFLEE